MNRSFGVIGGDRRQAELARLLSEEGRQVSTHGLRRWQAPGDGPLEQAAAADVVILPLPLCRETGILELGEGAAVRTRELFRQLRPEQLLLAGQVRPEQQREAEELGLDLKISSSGRMWRWPTRPLQQREPCRRLWSIWIGALQERRSWS